MENRNGYLMQGSLAAMLALGLLLLVGSGPAFAAGLKNSNFKGSYLTSYQGFDSSITGTTGEPNPPAIPYAVSGEIVSDGKGNINGFENLDYGSPGTGAAATCTFTGTYSVGSSSNSPPISGSVTLNVTPSCATVTCTGTTTPSCTPGAFSASSRAQWFCALSGPSGKTLACTEMGEAASGTTFQTPISAVTWEKGQ